MSRGCASDACAVPLIEIADDTDALRVGRPHAEGDAGDALDFDDVRAKFLVSFGVRAFAEKMQIEIRKQRSESVRIAEFAVGETLLADLPAIGKWRERQFAFAGERGGVDSGRMNALGRDWRVGSGVKN